MEKQGKIKGLKLNQFKKKHDIMGDEQKEKPDTDEVGGEEGKDKEDTGEGETATTD